MHNNMEDSGLIKTNDQEIHEKNNVSSTENISSDINNEHQSPQYLQQKLYFLLEHLKTMHSELPERYQMRMPYDLLTHLANALINETIFEIVKRLIEIQNVTESHLFELRKQAELENEKEVEGWMVKITDKEELEHILALMKIKHKKKMKETDQKLILHLDAKVLDQQKTLEEAGVPGFYVTSNPKEINIQMHLIDFILRLSRLKFDPNAQY
ncbi:gonadal protein gdl [Contarinia nasturtii]|uniref:gonadal protein gdl n=1 Tax=Contarinia nasturtii TaxID=265458 RepID=UPI0012D430AC|nr:gonadal protein gdl [Contarinia nasturtii]